MTRRTLRYAVPALLALLALLLGALPAEAQKYRYGRYASTDSQGEQFKGVYLYLDVIAANPRNTDIVLATVQSGGAQSPVIPTWDTEPAGRFGLGYQWANGNRIEARFTGASFTTETFNNGSQGTLFFAIGPPVPGFGDMGSPGTLGIETEISATTADVLFGHVHRLGQKFDLDWSLGLRYALYEETSSGVYGQLGGTSYDAAKTNEGEMVGARIALRGDYRFAAKFSVSGNLGFSFLDGELRATSSLTPTGSTSPASFASLTDDSRSGTITEIELLFNFYVARDAVRIYAGWTQSVWSDIAADLMRNFPDQTVPLRDRYDVTFSGYLLGVGIRF